MKPSMKICSSSSKYVDGGIIIILILILHLLQPPLQLVINQSPLPTTINSPQPTWMAVLSPNPYTSPWLGW